MAPIRKKPYKKIYFNVPSAEKTDIQWRRGWI